MKLRREEISKFTFLCVGSRFPNRKIVLNMLLNVKQRFVTAFNLKRCVVDESLTGHMNFPKIGDCRVLLVGSKS